MQHAAISRPPRGAHWRFGHGLAGPSQVHSSAPRPPPSHWYAPEAVQLLQRGALRGIHAEYLRGKDGIREIIEIWRRRIVFHCDIINPSRSPSSRTAAPFLTNLHMR